MTKKQLNGVFFCFCFLLGQRANDARKYSQAIENVDFRAIGSAELIQDPDTIMKMFTPGSPIMLEVKVCFGLMIFFRLEPVFLTLSHRLVHCVRRGDTFVVVACFCALRVLYSLRE